MKVPFVDLSAQSAMVYGEVKDRWSTIVHSGEFVGGPLVTEFERRWAEYCGAAHCVALANGTDAVELACRVRLGGLGRVTVPANTFIATVEGIVRAGLEPVVVDVNPSTLVARPDDEVDVAVALYGQHGSRARVVDASQAHGSSFDGRRQVGDVMTWSFYPSKPLGAWGDAGAITTDDGDLARHVRRLATHAGGPGSFNSRMDPLQAAVLLAKLLHLDEWNAQRRGAAMYYGHALDSLYREGRLGLVGFEAQSVHVHHLFVIRVRDRDEVLVRLHDAGVDARVHYARPVHGWNNWPRDGGGSMRVPSVPVEANMATSEVLSLPLWAGISRWQQDRVVDVLTDVLR